MRSTKRCGHIRPGELGQARVALVEYAAPDAGTLRATLSHDVALCALCAARVGMVVSAIVASTEPPTPSER